jgi:SseB protein N-terminal domain/SseB protein C-terminal domain
MPTLYDRFRRRLKGGVRLERALAKVEWDVPIEERTELYEALLRADLAVMTSEGQDDADQDIYLQLSVHDQGELTLPVFTNEEEMKAWNPDMYGGLVIAARDLFPYFLETEAQGLIINPAGELNGSLSRAEIAALADGVIPTGGDPEVLVVPRPEAVVEIARPLYEELPVDFIDALRSACAETAGVTRSYVFRVIAPSFEPHHVVGLCLAEDADPRAVVREVGRHIKARQLPDHDHTHYAFLDRKEGYEAAVRQVTGPVFER